MNVYDFDNTIYNGDCTLDFWRHCVRKFPGALRALPAAAMYGALFQVGLCSRERFKEKFYMFLKYVPDVTQEVKAFWNGHAGGIKSFYLKRRRQDDLVISASPDFLIEEICRRLSIAYVASAVDPNTGALKGPNCRGEEKVHRFQKEYPGSVIENFYSDSPADGPLAELAQNAFLIQKEQIVPWTSKEDCIYSDR